MATKKFLTVLAASLTVYFIIDYFFDHVMLYIMGGVIGGTINVIFDYLDIELGNHYIIFIWIALLAGMVFLFYRLHSKPAKYFTIVAIAILLYVVDTAFAGIPVSDMADTDSITLRNNLLFGLIILSKSLIFSLIIYFEKRFQKHEPSIASM